MKRLLRLSENINTYDNIQVNDITEDVDSMENMTKIDELSEADIKHDKCPQCGYNQLKKEDGFKVCPRCETVYKLLNSDGYVIDRRDK